jgi:deleted-in-malignant-brain-tumors protein 1
MLSTTALLVIVLVAAASLLTTEVQAQNNGDIRLVSNGINRGRLEVFIDEEWGTICGKRGTNFKAVAETACRQLGFDMLQGLYGTVTQQRFPVAPDNTPIHFGSINCGSSTSNLFDVCSTDYYQHVLRCAVDTKVDTTACTHDNDIGVSCSATRIIVKPYKSQIYFYAVGHGGQQQSPNISLSSLSSGVLSIVLEKSNERKGGLLCGEGFNKSAADTACRQLGYTNSNRFKTPLQTTNRTFWDVGLNCKSQSYSCLNNCFDNTPTSHTSCTNLVALRCEFNISLKNTESAGSPHLCGATVGNNCKTHFEEHTVVTIPQAVVVVIIVAILASCATCITLCVCCFVPGCPIHRKRSGRRATHSLSPKFSEALLTN